MKTAGAVVLAMAVLALMTAARINRYCPQPTLVPYLASATKVNESRAEAGGGAILRGIVQLCRNEEPVSIPISFREILRPKTILIVPPFYFRPPPRFA